MTDGVVALSGAQVLALLGDELDGTGPCQVAGTLPWTTLTATNVVPGARFLMQAIEEGGGRLTEKGFLNRKLVEALLDRAPWQSYEPSELRGVCKVFNESDFPPAGYLHVLLRVAGLARRQKGFLRLTRKGRQLLSEEMAGRLHAALFSVTFARYSLGYLDRHEGPDVFAPQIGLILYLIGRFCTDWRPADELMRSVTLPMSPATEIDPLKIRFSSSSPSAFSNRVLRYLCWFGLLEEAPRARGDWKTPRSFRKTPLYDRTLVFRLP